VFLVKHIFSGITLVQKVIHKDKNPDVLQMIHNEIAIMFGALCVFCITRMHRT
jgi:hypothetical protein